MSVTRAVLAVALIGCMADHGGPSVRGSSRDVSTAPGTYDGFRVVQHCAQGTVGVIGTGATPLATVDAIAAAGQDLHARLLDLASIWEWGGYGLVCEPGVGTVIALDDWRDVDTVIARTGAWLRERDLSLQVGITLGSIPVPAVQ